ncbi:9476_t:CDS:1 [Acaulospora morrowiae]|uniref:9476_t:CDS:1 n=1 Tax=Acaulospora morrowiae TaxID=94023 RepID=A0A9N8VJ54_9GLOM|nr:9476_t:CDS:1 [Acaulospora morrowiae]
MENFLSARNIVENNALRARLYYQVPNPNVVLDRLKKNGTRFRRVLKFTGYNAFATVLRMEANELLDEPDLRLLKIACSILWDDAPEPSKQMYIFCAQVVDANIRR